MFKYKRKIPNPMGQNCSGPPFFLGSSIGSVLRSVVNVSRRISVGVAWGITMGIFCRKMKHPITGIPKAAMST